MNRILKKPLRTAVLLSAVIALSACRTTMNERIMYGALAGAVIGAGVAACSDDDRYLAGITIGASTGTIIGALSHGP